MSRLIFHYLICKNTKKFGIKIFEFDFVTANKMTPLPGEGLTGQISITRSISKFLYQILVCVLTNEGYKTHQTDFLSVTWIMP